MLKIKNIHYLFIYLLGVVLQLFLSNIEVSLFKFPCNALILLLSLLTILLLRKFDTFSLYSFLLDKKTPLATLGMVTFNLIILGITPQLSIEESVERNTVLVNLGLFQWSTSWIFVLPMALLTVVLTIPLLEMKRMGRKWSSHLLLVGGLLVLIGSFWGAPDESKYRTVVTSQRAENKVFNDKNVVGTIPFSILLKDFEVYHYETGSVKTFIATLTITDGEKVFDEILMVNHPLSHRGYDIYLNDYKKVGDDYLVTLQLNYQRWKIITYSGLLIMMLGLLISLFRRDAKSVTTTKKMSYESATCCY